MTAFKLLRILILRCTEIIAIIPESGINFLNQKFFLTCFEIFDHKAPWIAPWSIAIVFSEGERGENSFALKQHEKKIIQELMYKHPFIRVDFYHSRQNWLNYIF